MAFAVILRLRAFFAKFYQLAVGKVTTYVALATAALTELTSSWDSTAAVFPPWLLAHKQHVFSVAALLTIWTRVRRELHATDKP